MEDLISKVAIWVLPVLLAITLHEAAHGYVARMFGDRTAERLGRISLNPIKHIDPIGTLLVPAVLWVGSSGSFTFGWAKPVPVAFGNLRDPKRDMLWVAAAGPMANLVMAVGWAALTKVVFMMPPNGYSEALTAMAFAGITINLLLLVLNLLPVPPLDGGRMLVSVLPDPLAGRFAKIERYGLLILVALLVTHVLDHILVPLISNLSYFLALIFGF
ncbi:site-2 protease family protein [Nitrogeniibacter aestuarii]|uniref:site-2 protease family protein n=1 Tax=Nitrogeniibacter aestuarii TaxID=2815343 RepID=UPI001E60C96A|nr:site-2 protease family protein [Nitrogeniibacter aestuarii]